MRGWKNRERCRQLQHGADNMARISPSFPMSFVRPPSFVNGCVNAKVAQAVFTFLGGVGRKTRWGKKFFSRFVFDPFGAVRCLLWAKSKRMKRIQSGALEGTGVQWKDHSLMWLFRFPACLVALLLKVGLPFTLLYTISRQCWSLDWPFFAWRSSPEWVRSRDVFESCSSAYVHCAMLTLELWRTSHSFRQTSHFLLA